MQQHYDLIVIGGGLSGFACALQTAQSGRDVLLIERRPALGWESAWAGQTNWAGAEAGIARQVYDLLASVNGARDGLVDAAAVEIALDRLAARAGVDVQLYTYAIRPIFEGDTLFGVVLGSRCGEQVVQASALVDATAEGVLWRQTGIEATASAHVSGTFSFWMNHAPDTLSLPLDLGGGLIVHPSLWPGEVRVEYQTNGSNALLARRDLPAAIRRVRAEVPPLAEALVSHVANEPFPLVPLIAFDSPATVHPALKNLFGANTWAGKIAPTPTALLDLGERVAEMASKVQARQTAAPLITGSTFDQPEVRGDVLVVGGGTGGAIAAIVAAREGVKTVLIENLPALGGVGTTGAIHSYYYGISGGLQDEVDARLAEMTPLFCGRWAARGFHPEVKKQVLQDMALEAGVEVYLDTVVTGVLLKDKKVQPKADPGTDVAIYQGQDRNALLGVLAATPTGGIVFDARVFIDSTGDGDVAAMAGAPFALGRDSDHICHTYSQPAGRIDAQSGELVHLNFDAGYVDPTSIADLSRARRYGIRLYWQEPFDAQNRVLYIAPLIGIRQGRQIVGEYQLTLADEIAGRRFDDAISFTHAHYDNHGYDYENESAEAALWVWALGNWRALFGCEVPYRCLLPQGIDGLLVASRAISITYDAHHMFRMQKDIQRIGEVAALAAVQAIRKGVVPREIDVAELQAKLKARGLLDERHRPAPMIAEGHLPELPAPGELDAGQAKDLVWLSTRQGEHSLPMLRDALNLPDSDVRFTTSVALASRGDESGLSALRRYLVERDETVPQGERTVPRWQAAIPFLGVAQDVRAVPALLEVLQTGDVSLDALIAAVRALGRIGDASAVAALDALLDRDDLPFERTFRTIPGVNQAAENARWQLDLAVAEALARLGAPGERVSAIVQPYLDDDRAYVVRHAHQVLTEAGLDG